MRQFDVLVVGGGTAGMTAAAEASRFGLSVGLVERGRLGGTSLWTGEVPTQALLYCGSVAGTVRRADEFGVRAGRVEVDFAAVLDRVRAVVRAIQPRRSPEHLRSLGIETLKGEASFLDAGTLAVGEEQVRAKRIVLATGSRPKPPDVDGLQETGYLTHEDLWEMDRLPARLAVLGGTPMGVETAQALARLGSQVTLIEKGDRILQSEDAELAERLAESLRAEGIDVWVGAEVVQVLRRGDVKSVAVRVGQQQRELEVEQVFVAAGRAPNVEALNLAATEIETTRTGIVVDRHLRTTGARVWAVGDVNGTCRWSRAAEMQARAAVADALFPWSRAAGMPAVAWTVFTDPELAHAGMTEAEARRRLGDRVKVYAQPLAEVDRAVCQARTAGVVKLVVDGRGRLVGGHVLAPHAGEMVAVVARAVSARERPDRLRPDLFAGATLSEGILLAARQAREERLYTGRPMRFLKWLARRYV